MQEFIIDCGGLWWHFFYKPGYGLCFRKKDGMRFSEPEILLSNAIGDYYVLSLGSSIHIACQDENGSILYITYNGSTWEKLTLLEAKSPKPYPKHFFLIPVGSYINLFYVIEYKEKHMLVHQLLNTPSEEPTVVDYITVSSDRPFSVCPHTASELSVYYQNAQGICGIRTYRWSLKSYTPFTRLKISSPALSSSMWVKEDDSCCFAATIRLENMNNLICIRREPDGSFSDITTVYLDCSEHPQPVFFQKGNRLYLEWLDNGNVMMSYSEDGGIKWKKPVKYMRSNSATVTLYCICHENKSFFCYGFSDNGTINLYDADNPLQIPPSDFSAPKFRPRGSEAADFARSFGYRRPPDDAPEPEYVLLSVYKRELDELKEMILKQNEAISALSGQLEYLRESTIAENTDDIDRILFSNPKSSAKIVVTGQ